MSMSKRTAAHTADWQALAPALSAEGTYVRSGGLGMAPVTTDGPFPKPRNSIPASPTSSGSCPDTAFAELAPPCRQLLAKHPPLSYQEISAILQVSKGSIGPQRARCVDRLRRSPHLAAFIGEDTGTPRRSPEGEPSA